MINIDPAVAAAAMFFAVVGGIGAGLAIAASASRDHDHRLAAALACVARLTELAVASRIPRPFIRQALGLAVEADQQGAER